MLKIWSIIILCCIISQQHRTHLQNTYNHHISIIIIFFKIHLFNLFITSFQHSSWFIDNNHLKSFSNVDWKWDFLNFEYHQIYVIIVLSSLSTLCAISKNIIKRENVPSNNKIYSVPIK